MGGGQGGRGVPPPPETADREISADLPGKERKGRKIEKGKVENWKWNLEEKYLFYNTTKMRIFYQEKIFHAGKKRLFPLYVHST